MAKLYTYFTHGEFGQIKHDFEQIFVIDVLRATTTMAVALENGVKEIYPVASEQDALEKKEKLKANGVKNVVLAGERRGEKIASFDYGNSPLEFMNKSISGKTVVMTTSNGTQALQKCKDVKSIYILANANLKSTAKMLQPDRDAAIICAGSHLEFSIEDALCAGLFINIAANDAIWEFNDQSRFAVDFIKTRLPSYPPNSVDFYQEIKGGIHARRLFSLNAEKDVKFSCRFDIYESCVIFDGESVYSGRK